MINGEPWSEAVDLTGCHPFLLKRSKRTKNEPLVQFNHRVLAERKERWTRAIDVLWLDTTTPQDRAARWSLAREVWKIACEYNGYRQVSHNAPRVSTVEKELIALERAAKALANAIDALGDKTIEALENGGEDFFSFDRDYNTLRDRVYTLGLPQYAAFTYDGLEDDHLVPRLRLLESLCSSCRTRFLGRLGSDKGGGTDLYRREWGSPTWHLARLCFEAVRNWGHEPKSTDGSVYHRFALAVHEFATGEADGPTGLGDQLRNGAAILGRHAKLISKMPRYFGDPHASISEAEMNEFHQLSSALQNGRRPQPTE